MEKMPRREAQSRQIPLQEEGEERERLLSRMLRERRQVLQQALPARSGSQDVADAAQEEQEEAVSVATLNLRHQMLAQVDEALTRLAAGRYGLCAECGEPILVARLRALPFAIRCCGCQERIERRDGAGEHDGGPARLLLPLGRFDVAPIRKRAGKPIVRPAAGRLDAGRGGARRPSPDARSPRHGQPAGRRRAGVPATATRP